MYLCWRLFKCDCGNGVFGSLQGFLAFWSGEFSVKCVYTCELLKSTTPTTHFIYLLLASIITQKIQAFARGILCNWLVTTAVFIAQGCSDLVSKATIVVLIITIFASLGFEHSVANMFVGPFGAFNGGPTFMTFFLKNLVPASLGNIVGGFFVVGFWYYITLGSGGKIWRKE